MQALSQLSYTPISLQRSFSRASRRASNYRLKFRPFANGPELFRAAAVPARRPARASAACPAPARAPAWRVAASSGPAAASTSLMAAAMLALSQAQTASLSLSCASAGLMASVTCCARSSAFGAHIGIEGLRPVGQHHGGVAAVLEQAADARQALIGRDAALLAVARPPAEPGRRRPWPSCAAR